MKLTLAKKVSLGQDVVSFIFNPEKTIVWEPGQFMRFVLKHESPDERGTERWFTISSAPFEKTITITTKLTPNHSSSFKKALTLMKIGGSLEADRPIGDFILKEVGENNIFLAGGIGITPFRSIFAQKDYEQAKINGTLLYLSNNNSFIFKDELDEYTQSSGIKAYYLKKRPDDLINGLNPTDSSAIYISGPAQMVDAYKKIISLRGYKDDQVMTDFFPGYD